MKTWSWFAIPPLVIAAAYAVMPVLVTSLTGHNAAAVMIAQLNLPDDTAKPVAEPAAGREIDYSVFGDMTSKGLATPKQMLVEPVVVEPALQSILMTDGGGIAVVDGISVREGDKVGAYRVAKIEPWAVTLTITRTTSTRVGKRIKREPKEELKVLHFPDYLDADISATKLATHPGAADAHEQKPDQIKLEQKYKQILEQLK